MRAIAVSEYGSAPVVAEVPKPQPGPGQLLIKDAPAAFARDGHADGKTVVNLDNARRSLVRDLHQRRSDAG